MKKLPILALLLMFIGIEAKAQVKIGYTNPEMILSNLAEVKAIETDMKLLLANKDSLLAIKAEMYQNEMNELVAKKLPTAELEAKIDSIRNEFEAERQKSYNELQQKQLASLRPIEEKVFETIQIVADSLGLDLVLNEGSINGGAFIFYASEDQIDITEMVIEKLKKS